MSAKYLYDVEPEMIMVASNIKVGTGISRKMEGCRSESTGTTHLNLGALVSGKQKHSNEGTLTSPRPVECRAGSQTEFIKRGAGIRAA